MPANYRHDFIESRLQVRRQTPGRDKHLIMRKLERVGNSGDEIILWRLFSTALDTGEVGRRNANMSGEFVEPNVAVFASVANEAAEFHGPSHSGIGCPPSLGDMGSVHSNELAGPWLKIWWQSARRCERLVMRKVQGVGDSNEQIIRRRILALALDPRQIWYRNIDACCELGQSHSAIFADVADETAKLHWALRG